MLGPRDQLELSAPRALVKLDRLRVVQGFVPAERLRPLLAEIAAGRASAENLPERCGDMLFFGDDGSGPLKLRDPALISKKDAAAFGVPTAAWVLQAAGPTLGNFWSAVLPGLIGRLRVSRCRGAPCRKSGAPRTAGASSPPPALPRSGSARYSSPSPCSPVNGRG